MLVDCGHDVFGHMALAECGQEIFAWSLTVDRMSSVIKRGHNVFGHQMWTLFRFRL